MSVTHRADAVEQQHGFDHATARLAESDAERKAYLDRRISEMRCLKCGKLLSDRQKALYDNYHRKCAPKGTKARYVKRKRRMINDAD